MPEDALAAWDALATTDHSWMTWRFAALSQLLADHGLLAHQARVLDVGGAQGVVGAQATAVGLPWTVEVSYPRVGSAPPPIGAYDGVLLLDVLEHVADEHALIRQFLLALKPRGWLVVNVPARQELYSWFDRTIGHLRRYNRYTLTQALIRGGLSPLLQLADMRYWGFGLLPFALWLRLQTPGDVAKGFGAPGWLHALLLWYGGHEVRYLRRPLLGTSLLVLAYRRKPNDR